MAVVKVTRPGFDGGAALADGTATAAPGGPSSVTVSAASTLKETPRSRFLIGSVVFVIVVGIAAFVLDLQNQLRDPLKLAGDVNAFALIYIAAQAIERLLEPFSYYLLPVEADKEAAKDKKDAVVVADGPDAAMAVAKEAADQAAVVNRKQSERAILFWCLASLIGVIVSAAFGLQFLAIVLDEASRPAVPGWFDVVATGLVIGGGTKALHGLVERISKPKDDEATS